MLILYVFTNFRPDIPEDNIVMMWCLGVRECPNQLSGCDMQMWEWEMEDHMRYSITLTVIDTMNYLINFLTCIKMKSSSMHDKTLQ